MAHLAGRCELCCNADLPDRVPNRCEIDLETVGQRDAQFEVHLPALVDCCWLLWSLNWSPGGLVSPPKPWPLMEVAPDLGRLW